MKSAFLLLALPLGLAACGTTSGYPSLAKRPFETGATVPAPAPAPPPPAPLDPAVTARIDSALSRVKASEGPFAAALARARPEVAAAAGAPAGSETWIAGQMAASSVEPLREPAAAALAELEDELRAAMQRPDSADRAAIQAAIEVASGIVARQQMEAAALAEQLSD